MKISEYIAALTALQAEHGDLEMNDPCRPMGRAIEPITPYISHRLTLEPIKSLGHPPEPRYFFLAYPHDDAEKVVCI